MISRPAPDSSLVARFVSSPNYGQRRGYRGPDCLILHYTGMPTGEAALKALTDPASEVSAHYLVWEGGSSTSWSRSATAPGTRAGGRGRAKPI